MVTEQLSHPITKNVEVVPVFSFKPLSLSELTRIASDKVRIKHKIDNYINVLDKHYFVEYGVYVVLVEVPRVSECHE